MRRNIFILLFILVLMPLTAQQKPILTVLDFQTDSVSDAEMRSVISQLSGALFDTGLYRIIDASQRDMLLKEVEFSMSDCTDKACQLQAGKILAAEFIVTGEIDRVGSRISLSCKLLVTETGRLEGNFTQLYSNFDALLDDMPSAVAKLSGKDIVSAPSPSPTPQISPTPAVKKPKPGRAARVIGTIGAVAGYGTALAGGAVLLSAIPLYQDMKQARDSYEGLPVGTADSVFEAAHQTYLDKQAAYQKRGKAGLFLTAGGLAGGIIFNIIASAGKKREKRLSVLPEFGPAYLGFRLQY